MARSDIATMEESLANSAFMHGYEGELANPTDKYPTLKFVCNKDGGCDRKFNGITIDTFANRRSIMCQQQYEAYQEEFGRRIPMCPPRKDVKGIGGSSRMIGEVTIQIPFTRLNVVLDIELSIIRTDTPSLLSNKDMLDNGLDISLQGG